MSQKENFMTIGLLRKTVKKPFSARSHANLLSILVSLFYLVISHAPGRAETSETSDPNNAHFEKSYKSAQLSQAPFRFFSLPKLPPLKPGENLEHVTYRTGLKETLRKIFSSLGLSKRESQPWLVSVQRQYPGARLVEGKELHFYFTKIKPSLFGDRGARQLKALEVELENDKVLSWEKGGKGIIFARRDKAYEVQLISVAGTIESSFVEDGLRAGLNPTLLSQLVDIFSWEFDFENDLKKGDAFKLIYEKRLRIGGSDSVSFRILAAEVTNGDQNYGAIYFEKEKGSGKYYDLNGRSLARAFLRFPLEFIGISSFFSHSRFHPILKADRPHNGVDFMAKRGTPVRAVGDGKIEFAGWRKGGYGRIVEIEHDSTYSSRYAHLQGLAKGIAKGIPVRKGQVIGYVGSSGLTTGPHLHFEFYKNQTYVDPLKVDFPAEDEIEPSLQRLFENTKRFFLTQMDLTPNT
ncbi:MAG: peptidoglycan DD-metalloendopeptidase family protein [Candidatus Binatia bacterium]